MSEDLFVKKHRNGQLAQAEFDRTLEIYNLVTAAKPTYLRIARPINVKDSTVCFEKVTGCVNLRKLICRLRIDTQILYRVGQALAELHLALNPALSSLDDSIHIHGDFSATNVLYSPSSSWVYIVDFARYRHDVSESYSYGPAYRDLAHIVLTLEIKYPLHKIYLLARRKNKEMSAKFWAGYDNIITGRIDRKKLFEYIIKDIDFARSRFEQKNPVSCLVWTRLFDRAKKRYVNQID